MKVTRLSGIEQARAYRLLMGNDAANRQLPQRRCCKQAIDMPHTADCPAKRWKRDSA